MIGVGLLNVEKQGRHRYYRLAAPSVAQMLESIMQVASELAPSSKKVAVGPKEAALRRARTCYDHFASLSLSNASRNSRSHSDTRWRRQDQAQYQAASRPVLSASERFTDFALSITSRQPNILERAVTHTCKRTSVTHAPTPCVQ